MKHVMDAILPYFEIAPGLRVNYARYQDGNPYDDEPLLVLLDQREIGAYCVAENPVKEAKMFAEMLQAVYDKGKTDGCDNARAADRVGMPPIDFRKLTS